MIKSLSKEVQAHLRSGIAIFSLQQCVEELVLNSIDAGATCVAVKLDIEACKVQVLDNGSGMDPENMEKVGNRYCTSKCSSLEDLDNLRFNGFRGEAIASMADLATMVEISSRTKHSVKTFIKRFNEGKGSDVFEAPTTRPSAGTTVLICNFFHNMPVRRKRMDSALEVERVRQRLEAISLMHPSVSLTVKRECSGTLLVQLPKARNTYYRFVQIHGLARAQKLREVNHTYGQFQITGHIGREGHYNNSLQFLFVNGRLVLKTRIHKLLNSFLRRLSSSSESPNTSSIFSSPKQRGGADSYGVFVLNVKCHYSEYDVCLEPAKSLIEFKDWDGLDLCIEETVKEFLVKENLVSEGLQESSPSEDPRTLVSGTFQGTVEDAESSGVAEKTGSVEAQEVQILGLDSASSNTQSRTSSESDPEIQDVDVIEDTSQINSVSETDEERLAQHASPPDLTDRDFPRCVNNSNRSRIVMLDHKETYDSLRRFLEPNQSCAPKRKPSLSDAQGRTVGSHCEPKIAKVKTCHKLPLSFATGSLDKFKRMFGKGVETPTNAQITDTVAASAQADVCVDGLCLYNSTCKRKRVSLAAKLSHKLDSHKPDQHGCEEALVSISDQRVSENEGFSNHDEKLQDDPPDEPALTAPQSPDPSVPITTGKTELTKYTTSPQPDTSTGQIVNPESHDPVASKTGNEEQSVTESDQVKQSDWLTLYDGSLGQSVYVNQVTGLSKYKDPSLEEPQVACTSNVTNMAVSVVSKSGFEYRCYPFQTELVLPFLPKPRAERMLISSTDCAGNACWEPTRHENKLYSICTDWNFSRSVKDQDETRSSLAALFSEWNNPVFVRPAQVAMDVSSDQAEGLAVKIHNILFPYRFTKDMIHSMKVVNQVDKKFLACLINTTDQKTTEESDSEGNLLVLVDQHAAHERVRLEGLVRESYQDDPDVAGKKRLCSSSVIPPLEISVTEEETRLLRLHQTLLRDQALEISFPQTEGSYVLLKRLPTCFVEKENMEKRRGRRSVIKSIAQEYLREHIEFLQTTGRVRGSLPLTVHNVLASQACHGAIKFNDDLSKEECCSLVASLSSCQLPFQCAHGRPSILPIADLLHLEDEQDLPKPNLRKLRRLYKAWQLYGKN